MVPECVGVGLLEPCDTTVFVQSLLASLPMALDWGGALGLIVVWFGGPEAGDHAAELRVVQHGNLHLAAPTPQQSHLDVPFGPLASIAQCVLAVVGIDWKGMFLLLDPGSRGDRWRLAVDRISVVIVGVTRL